jgi:hypothetical protein
MARYGRGRVRLVRKHPDSLSPASFVPAAWLAGLVAGLPAGLAWYPLWWVYGGMIAIYLAVVLATSAALALRPREPQLLRWLPLVFLTVHIGAGWGVLDELLSGRNGAASTGQE